MCVARSVLYLKFVHSSCGLQNRVLGREVAFSRPCSRDFFWLFCTCVAGTGGLPSPGLFSWDRFPRINVTRQAKIQNFQMSWCLRARLVAVCLPFAPIMLTAGTARRQAAPSCRFLGPALALSSPPLPREGGWGGRVPPQRVCAGHFCTVAPWLIQGASGPEGASYVPAFNHECPRGRSRQ